VWYKAQRKEVNDRMMLVVHRERCILYICYKSTYLAFLMAIRIEYAVIGDFAPTAAKSPSCGFLCPMNQNRLGVLLN